MAVAVVTDRGVSDIPAPGQLVVESRIDGDTLVVSLRGELDLTSAPEFERELEAPAEPAPRRVVIDLSGLEFMDSTGLRALLAARDRVRNQGQQLILRRGSRQVQRVLELTKTLDAFEFED
jgi:anti-sigma B factor antagonist